MSVWKDSIFNNLHLTLQVGKITSKQIPLVRVHVPNMLHDMIGTDGYGDRIDLRSALRKNTLFKMWSAFINRWWAY